MFQTIGPVSIRWDRPSEETPHAHQSPDWWVSSLGDEEASRRRGPDGAAWFNEDGWSGIETREWVAWISNRAREAAVWGQTGEAASREALSVVIPAILRREGLLDGHGAIIAPDSRRPDEGVFVTGLSGSGKSTLAISAALGGARLVSDDSVAIGPEIGSLRGWSRRSAMSLSAPAHRLLFPDAPRREVEGKVWFDARDLLGSRYVDSLRVRCVVFLEPAADRGGETAPSVTSSQPIGSADSYRRILMGHPILSMDVGARKCFGVVRALADMPAYRMVTGRDALESPRAASAALSALLPIE